MYLPDLLVEYLITGTCALSWLAIIWSTADPDAPAKLLLYLRASGSAAIVALLAPIVYVSGMVIDFIANYLLEGMYHVLNTVLPLANRGRELSKDESKDDQELSAAEISLRSPEVGQQLTMRSSRDRIARGLFVNFAVLVTVLSNRFRLRYRERYYWQTTLFVGLVGIIVIYRMWLRFEDHTQKFKRKASAALSHPPGGNTRRLRFMSSAESLPSWSDRTKQEIVKFVEAVKGPSGVPPEQRIAVFDSDGTLCCEKPIYMQLQFLIDRLGRMYPGHSFIATFEGLVASSDHIDPEKLFRDFEMSIHLGIPVDDYTRELEEWLATANHPRYKCSYLSRVYKPMLELIDYLGANEFKIYVVSGSGIEFLRIFWQQADRQPGFNSRIPSGNIIGSALRTDFEIRNSKPLFTLLPWPEFIDDGRRKAVSIHEFVGRPPIAAFGNSDGDIEMLQWTHAGGGQRLVALIHHTDDIREYRYDHKAEQALTQARANNWFIVDIKEDWKGVSVFI